MAFIELGQGQKGINEIYRAIKLQPNTFGYQLDFARALFAADRLDEAISTLYTVERLATGDNELAQVYFWWASMLEAEGEHSLAQAARSGKRGPATGMAGNRRSAPAGVSQSCTYQDPGSYLYLILQC